MRITSQKCRPGPAESLKMNLVADTVTRTRVIRAGFGGDGLQIKMIVMVFGPELAHIMIDIANRNIRPRTSKPHRLKQQKSSRPSCILRKGLVDPNSDRLPSRQFPLDQMSFKYFISKRTCHDSS